MSEEEVRKVFSRNLNWLIQREHLTQKMVAAICGVSTSTVSTWCKGINIPRMDKIEILANHFGVTKSDLLEEKTKGTSPAGTLPIEFSHLKKIPVLGRIAAGVPIYAEENIEGYTYTDLNGGHEYFGLKVRGDSMDAAGIKDNYTVVVRRQDVVENGQIAVCLIDGEEATLKRFSQAGNIVTLMPQSTNPVHKPFVYNLNETSVTILGLVVEVKFSVE